MRQGNKAAAMRLTKSARYGLTAAVLAQRRTVVGVQGGDVGTGRTDPEGVGLPPLLEVPVRRPDGELSFHR